MAAPSQANNSDNNSHANPREWHVYYSKAKQREYYFDPVSQESTWVLPANANRVTDVRNNNNEGDISSSSLRKLLLLGAFLMFGLWLSTHSFPFSNIIVKQIDSNKSVSSEQIIHPPSAVKGNEDSDASSKDDETNHHHTIPYETLPSSWKKVLEKEVPHDQELDQLAKNIEAALQSSEDLLKKIVADAKEAGMEIKSSAFTY